MTYSQWQLEEHGYKTITTYWDDFSIADHFGLAAIKDTFKRALLNEDYKMMTELYLVLNHKIWAHYNAGRMDVAKVYDELWRKCGAVIDKTFTAEQFEYFYRITD